MVVVLKQKCLEDMVIVVNQRKCSEDMLTVMKQKKMLKERSDCWKAKIVFTLQGNFSGSGRLSEKVH